MIEEYLKQGKPYKEIQALTGLSFATISYHAKKLNLLRQPEQKKFIDWEAIQKDIDNEYTRSELLKKYKISGMTLDHAVTKKTITQPVIKKKVFEDVIIEDGRKADRLFIKRNIISKKLIPYICSECGQNDKWNNKKLTLHLDHINGINNDNRLENLRFLCPNCHTQTPTYGFKKRLPASEV